MISVITLTYKNYNGLFGTIASVLDQDVSEYEYIISDDGSGNFPEQSVIDFVNENKKANLKRFEIVLNKKNVGTVKHLNNAIKKCQGEYIFDICTNDFFVNKHAISDVVNTFEEEKCDVLITSRLEHINEKIVGMCPHYLDRNKALKLNDREKMYSALLRTHHYDMFIGPNYFYKKSVVERNGYFDENYVLLEDAPMLEKLIWNEKVSIRPDIFVVNYDCHDGVSVPGKRNALLSKDINFYNHYGKLKHFEYLDKNTQSHIKFGIEREEADSVIKYLIVCTKNCFRIIDFIWFYLIRIICGLYDKFKISSIDVINYGKIYK